MSNNYSYASIKIREEDKMYLEDLKRRKNKKLHEVVTEVIEAHRFVETLMHYLDCKTVDDVLKILSEYIPVLQKRILTGKLNELQEEIYKLSEEGIIERDEAEKIDLILGKAMERIWINNKTTRKS
jgi:hypothetical protein